MTFDEYITLLRALASNFNAGLNYRVDSIYQSKEKRINIAGRHQYDGIHFCAANYVSTLYDCLGCCPCSCFNAAFLASSNSFFNASRSFSNLVTSFFCSLIVRRCCWYAPSENK